MKEEWRTINGFSDYEVSNYGRVRSKDRYRPYRHGMRFVKGVMMKPYTNWHRKGYEQISLSDHSEHFRFEVHRLVAEAFIPNPDNKPQVNHIDCNPRNNRVDNLEWVTAKENAAWMIKCGRQRITTEKPLIATNIRTGQKLYLKSSKEAERKGFQRASIWRCLVGEYSHHHGYTWNYA